MEEAPTKQPGEPEHPYHNEAKLPSKEYRKMRLRGNEVANFLYNTHTVWRQRENARQAKATGEYIDEGLLRELEEKGPMGPGEVVTLFKKYRQEMLASYAASIVRAHKKGKPPDLLDALVNAYDANLYDAWLVGDWTAHWEKRSEYGPGRPPKLGLDQPHSLADFDQYLALLKEAANMAGHWPKETPSPKNPK